MDEVEQKRSPEEDEETIVLVPVEQDRIEPVADSDIEEADDVVVAEAVSAQDDESAASEHIKAVIEAAIYITDEPLSLDQIATAVQQPIDQVKLLLDELQAEYARPHRGLNIRELAGGYKLATKPEHHEAIRQFVKNLKPPLKLSLPALETLAVVAYRQPVTAPEIMDIRGVHGAGVLKTLLDRKLIAAGGRKNVMGKPIMYKTTRDFLIQFGLNSLADLPTQKEFEEISRLAIGDTDVATPDEEPSTSVTIEVPPDEQTNPNSGSDEQTKDEDDA